MNLKYRRSCRTGSLLGCETTRIGVDNRNPEGLKFRFIWEKGCVEGTGEEFLITESDEELFSSFCSLRKNAISKCQGNKKLRFEREYVSELEGFAHRFGPLFGFFLPREKNGRMYIDEYIDDWKLAQEVMELAFAVYSFANDKPFDHFLVDKYLSVEFDKENKVPMCHVVVSYKYTHGGYSLALKRSISNNRLDMFGGISGETSLTWSIAERDDSIRFVYSQDIVKGEICYPCLATALFNEGHTCHFSEVEWTAYDRVRILALFRIIAEGHLGGLSFGYASVFDEQNPNAIGDYGILSDSLLSYMWHKVSLLYSNNSFSVCANPKCGNVIVKGTGSNARKRYCSSNCRAQANNSKNGLQRTRASKAFYDLCLPSEVYKRAFQKEYSFKDEEHKVLRLRLNRWVRQLAATKRGFQVMKQVPEWKDWFDESR